MGMPAGLSRTSLFGLLTLLVIPITVYFSSSLLSPDSADNYLTLEDGDEVIAAFDRTWRRTDGLVASGEVQRTWIWGPAESSHDALEPYAEAPGGQRRVRYFDKSRMEVTYPDGDPSDPWYVTNGLLVRELISGERQVGDEAFQAYAPSTGNVAGDPNGIEGPTYSSLRPLLGLAPRNDGELIIERVSRQGTAMVDESLSVHGITSAHRVDVPGINHQVASVFWEFMNATGPIIEEDMERNGQLFESPFFATGLPLTEAYWTTVQVGGVQRDVLFQAFERRVLTYTPENPPGWQVESGNVGQHYFAWLQEQPEHHEPVSTPIATPEVATPTITPPPDTPTATPTSPSTQTSAPIYVGEGAVDSWMRSVVRDTQDRLWIVAMNNNPNYRGLGPGELRIYKATEPGIPGAFVTVDDATVAATDGGQIPFADAAIDGEDRLHIAWLDRGGQGQPVRYGVFDLADEHWLAPPETVDLAGLSGFGGNAGQGGLSIGINPDGTVLLAYTVAAHHTDIRVRTRNSSGWTDTSIPISASGSFIWHPALALSPDGTWYLAAYDGTKNRILSTTLEEGGSWTPMQLVAEDVLGPESIDQSPAIVVLPNGTPVVAYVDAASHIRVSSLTSDGWQEIEIGGDYHTHAPGLGLFADGRLIIAGHDEGSPPLHINGVSGSLEGWGDWAPLAAISADGSQVFRWAGAFFSAQQDYIDLVFFDEDTNDDGSLDDQSLYYMMVRANDN